MMSRNAGNLDRVLRVIVGVALIAGTLLGVLGAWAWVGLVPIATAAAGWCPLYALLGLNTCPARR